MSLHDFTSASGQPSASAPSGKPNTLKRDLGIGLGVFLLVLVPFLYFTGLLNRGYESRHVTFGGFSSSESGVSLGMKTMDLSAGQELVISYDVDVVRGGLLMWVKPTYAGIAADPIDTLRITSSGQGEFVVRAEDDGYHTLRITGSPDGDGYDVNYTVTWSVR